MKEKVTINRRNSRMLAKNLIILLSIAIIALVGILAWFSPNKKATAEGLSIVCNVPEGVEIAVVGHGDPAPHDREYKPVITLSPKNQAFLKKLSITEITGDGVNGNFYKPKLSQHAGVASPIIDSDWDYAKENVDFISFDLYFRSPIERTIYIDKSSSVKPVVQPLTWSAGTDTTELNPSDRGNFTRDAIVGAVRVAINKYDQTVDRKLLWIPAPNIQLTPYQDDFKITEGIPAGTTYEHTYYDVINSGDQKKKMTLKSPDVTTNTAGDYTLGTQKEILKISTKEEESEYFIDHVTCNLWIEGEDDEARLALVGGNFTVELDFFSDK